MKIIREIKNNIKNKKGFTLIEILLYIGIVSMLSLLLSSFVFLILQSKVKHQTVAIVDQEGIQLVNIISQAIRNAESINLPARGSAGSSLSIETEDETETPLFFNLSGTFAQIKEGSNSAINLNSSRTSVSNLSFSNLSKVDTPGSIKFQFTINYNNSSGRNEYEYSKTFYGTASLY